MSANYAPPGRTCKIPLGQRSLGWFARHDAGKYLATAAGSIDHVDDPLSSRPVLLCASNAPKLSRAFVEVSLARRQPHSIGGAGDLWRVRGL